MADIALLPVRIQKNIEIASSGCWVWLAYRDQNGYGQCKVKGIGTRFAHRIVYTLLAGPPPEGLDLDHLCRVPACVNPAHLEPVPHRTNILRGETIMAAQAKRTRCPRGHVYDITGKRGDGRTFRDCSICAKERVARAHAKIRAKNGRNATSDA